MEIKQPVKARKSCVNRAVFEDINRYNEVGNL